MLHQKKRFDYLRENFGELKQLDCEELGGLLTVGLDIAPISDHIYDRRCRCFGCQSREVTLQKEISREKKNK